MDKKFLQVSVKVEKVSSKCMNKYSKNRVAIVLVKVKIALKKVEYRDNLYRILYLPLKALE